MSRYLVMAIVGTLWLSALGCEMGPPDPEAAAEYGEQQGALGATERAQPVLGASVQTAKSTSGLATKPAAPADQATEDDPASDGCSGAGAISGRCGSTGAGAGHGVPQPLDPGSK